MQLLRVDTIGGGGWGWGGGSADFAGPIRCRYQDFSSRQCGSTFAMVTVAFHQVPTAKRREVS